MDASKAPPRPNYPARTAELLLATDLITPPTRAVIDERLEAPAKAEARYFGEFEFAVLRSLCERLIPQPDRETPIDLAGAIDSRLADGKNKGWRYAEMPPDGEAHVQALRLIDTMAHERYGSGFAALSPAGQDAIVTDVQRLDRTTRGEKRWLPFFLEDLLAEVVEAYYSHPHAQDEIGYAGYADADGWHHLGLNALDPHEPHHLGQAADSERDRGA